MQSSCKKDSHIRVTENNKSNLDNILEKHLVHSYQHRENLRNSITRVPWNEFEE